VENTAMNAIAPQTEKMPIEDSIGWCPNLERLRHEAQLAANGLAIDPWAVVEAECWLDLIDAELTAKSTRSNPRARAQLIVWRTEIARLRTQLKAYAEGGKQVSGEQLEKRAPSLGGAPTQWSRLQSAAADPHHHQPVYGGRFNEIPSAA
jgi:hypothetical protein